MYAFMYLAGILYSMRRKDSDMLCLCHHLKFVHHLSKTNPTRLCSHTWDHVGIALSPKGSMYREVARCLSDPVT